jgi:hypothetical protein
MCSTEGICSEFSHDGMTYERYVNDLFHTNIPNQSNSLS